MAIIRTITIRAKSHGGSDDLSIEPIGVRTKGAGANEELLWKSVGGRITSFKIDFNYPEGTPLTWTSKTSVGGQVASGPVAVAGATAMPFAYTVSVNLKAKGAFGARTIVIDPEVIVDDSTPPPTRITGKKKAARKRVVKRAVRRSARKSARMSRRGK